ncbi:MAG: hypothetical protein ACK5JR_21325 [Tropicimonas sp.]|uniref:hypothetical protein n=1 Tax=Tropicimonas sp. TaxID=2067044 RepID=UPI003A873967
MSRTLLGVNVIAAPVFDYRKQIIATVALVGSIQHLTSPPAPRHVEAICALSARVSAVAGYEG